MPGCVAEATDWLFASHEPLNDSLVALTDADLDRQVPTSFGEPRSIHQVFARLIKEQVHHGAEISLLRDLYRNRDSLRA
jgi:hypothetical protein